MTDLRYRPVVALDLDGVLRVPTPQSGLDGPSPPGTAEITMRRVAFPSYSHEEPPWDERGEWTGYHAFSESAAAWVRELVAHGTDVVSVSSWGAYINVYFAEAFGLPFLPFMDWADGVPAETAPQKTARWLSDKFPGRPLLWVSADAGPEAVAALRDRRVPVDTACTRVYLTDRNVGLTDTDATALNLWLDACESQDGQEELRRRERRRVRDRAAARMRERWGSATRYRRWRAARQRLGPVLGSGSVLLTLLADRALESPDDIDLEYAAKLRGEWGRPGDPPAEALVHLMRLPRRNLVRTNVLAWAGHGYPPALGGILSRGHAAGLRTLEVGRGWWPLLVALDDSLARLDPEYAVTAVRCRDGRLQFVVQSSAPHWYGHAVDQLVRAARKRAARTCERCGRAGKRQEIDGRRGAVLCAEHARRLSDEEIEFAVAAGVPRELFAAGGAIEGDLFAIPRGPSA